MGWIKQSEICGVGCSQGCSTFMVVLSFIYAALCLTFTTVMRLYLKAYYASAHLAALSFIMALFVFSHHNLYGRLRWMLHLSEWAFYLLQSILNIVYLLLCLALAIGYTVVMTTTIPGTMNFDTLTATILAWMDSFLLLYLMVLAVATAAKGHEEYQLGEGGSMHSIDPIIAYESADGINMQNFNDIQKRPSKDKESSCCSAQCCCAAIFWPVYTLFHLLFVFFVSFSVYQACGMAHDIITFREVSNMHVVKVEGHRPIGMYLECFGHGNDTILYENGFGVTMWISKPFVPKDLAQKYTVCMYDRRGYGWSETLESDYADSYVKYPQTAKTNVDFLKALLDKTNISKPFYYAGYSYGGHHAVYTALKYPEYIKGLIFIDSSNFGLNYEDLPYIFETLSNFKATGLLRLVLEHDLYDIAGAFREFINLNDLTTQERKHVYATFSSGTHFEAYVREWHHISREEVTQDLQGKVINFPALVINAGSRNDWFPQHQFPKFNASLDLHHVPGASHAEIALSKKFSKTTAGLIDEFIRRNSQRN